MKKETCGNCKFYKSKPKWQQPNSIGYCLNTPMATPVYRDKTWCKEFHLKDENKC